MLDQSQINALNAPLDKGKVKTNPKGYDYVEGWHAISEANRIFGFDGWDRQTVDMRQLGEPELVGANWRVAYHCRVRIIVRAGDTEVIRDGSGYGSGIGKDIRDVHESAIKEAETDAMKRALMTFGNSFGLALYDKAQTNVADDDMRARIDYVVACRDKIASILDVDALASWWTSDEQKTARRTLGLGRDQVETLKQAVVNRREALTQKEAA